MPESWEYNVKFVLETLRRLTAEQKESNIKLTRINEDIAVLKVKFFLIGCLASMIGGGVVSAIVMFVSRKL